MFETINNVKKISTICKNLSTLLNNIKDCKIIAVSVRNMAFLDWNFMIPDYFRCPGFSVV